MTGPVLFFKLKKEKPQASLLKLAAIFLILFALTLSFSPAVRNRSWQVDYRWQHWLVVLIWGIVFYFIYQQVQELAPKCDPLLLPITGLLTGWGLLSIWRLTSTFGMRQTLWLVVAAGLLIAGLRLKQDLNFLRQYKYLWLSGGLALTAATLVFGTNPLGYGPRLWLGFGVVYLQPSEPLKLLLIIYLAAYLADRQPIQPGLLPLLVPTIVMSGLALLLLIIQRDLGTASIFLLIYTAVIYTATGKRRLLVFLLITMLAAGFIGYQLFDLIRIRVDAWINPWLDPSGRSYQIVQSLIAVAAGGMFGRGPGLGNPGLVPISHSDFIFSSIAEEGGFLGTIGLLVALALLSLRGMRIALRSGNNFHRYLATGISAYFALQTILIIGGNIRMLPLTGVTLPFVSYGGSSLVTSYIALLLLIKISHDRITNASTRNDNSAAINLSGILCLGFAGVALVNGWWAIYRGPDLLTRTDNARRAISDRYVRRGALLDRNGEELTITTGEAGNYQRVYLEPELSPILGYTHPIYGQAGLEAALDLILRGEENQHPWVLWKNHFFYGQPPPGLDIHLTLDVNKQRFAQTLLGKDAGAVILMDASSGEILVMASNPSYDANLLDQEWGSLINNPNSPLINRAVQGNYQPGGSLGPLLLAASGTRGSLPEELLNYDLNLGEITITCTDSPSSATWHDVVSKGCPAPLSLLGLEMGSDVLLELFRNLRFYDPSPIHLTAFQPAIPAVIATPGAAAAGQGALRISPLQLAIAASALSNDGVIPAATIVLDIEDPIQGWDVYPRLTEPLQVFSSDHANSTATLLAGEDRDHWQTIAQAYNGAEQPLTWYVGGTLPGAEKALVVVVLLESDQPVKAEQIGRSLLAPD